MLNQENADDLLAATVFDNDDNKLGRVGRVYLDDSSGQPEWVTVQTGLFGTKETFLPLGQARLDGERLIVPVARDAVKSAPHIDADSGHLSIEEEQQLYRHYGLSYAGSSPDDGTDDDGTDDDGTHDDGTDDDGTDDDADLSSAAASADPHHPRMTAPDPSRDSLDSADSGALAAGSAGSAAGDEAPTTQAGLRLRRHLVIEEQQITVPVVREEYILEPDPGADGSDEPTQERPPTQR